MKNLVIVFAKNPVLGEVKTRLAKSVGDENALTVYKRLLEITEKATLHSPLFETHVYFSNEIDFDRWGSVVKKVQVGNQLGERMKNAFDTAFEIGFDKVIGVGADLPNLDTSDILSAIDKLNNADFVFGPAEDGGYYLVAYKNKASNFIFENKAWSTASLLKDTLDELKLQNRKVALLELKNDIDTLEDLKKSIISEEFKSLF